MVREVGGDHAVFDAVVASVVAGAAVPSTPESVALVVVVAGPAGDAGCPQAASGMPITISAVRTMWRNLIVVRPDGAAWRVGAAAHLLGERTVNRLRRLTIGVASPVVSFLDRPVRRSVSRTAVTPSDRHFLCRGRREPVIEIAVLVRDVCCPSCQL
ncbi:hypothetical protein JOF56_009970 [Kibdelosporangium banguiense]|uniref:Uncharacterized protein n=1 Tax=Kibdelosporangium banguiense TaxID=1365924 RepID=A0ABS4U083_9PSEU|nr:hypothetical protein [Kibdelosporangium banguiense]